MDYEPINPLASYTNEYGEEVIIHAPKGKNAPLRRYKGKGGNVHKLNRSIAVLSGLLIKRRREELGMTQAELCQRAGILNRSPKQFIYQIETPKRTIGVRQGTLFALAYALECEPQSLLPTLSEAMRHAGIEETKSISISAG